MFRNFALAALTLSAAAFFTAPVMAASTFYGIVIHVSTNNIKVHNPRSGQDLSFLLVPKFKQVFSDDGKTTYQMNAIKPGRYVGVIYDQRAFGQRHADKIYLLNNANERLSHQ